MSTPMGTIPTSWATLASGGRARDGIGTTITVTPTITVTDSDGRTRRVDALTHMADSILAAFDEPEPEPEPERHRIWLLSGLDLGAWSDQLAMSSLMASDSRLSSRGGDIVPGTVSGQQTSASDRSKQARVNGIARAAADPYQPFLHDDGTVTALGDHYIVHPDGTMTDVVLTPKVETEQARRSRETVKANQGKVHYARKCGHGTADGYVKGCDTCRKASKAAANRARRTAERDAARDAEQDNKVLAMAVELDRKVASSYR